MLIEELKKWIEDTIYNKNGKIIPYYARENIFKEKYESYYYEIFSHTDFLPEDNPLKERIFCIKNNITENILCSCGNPVNFEGKRYYKHCSPKCSTSDPLIQEKMKKTCFQNYGTESPFQSTEIRKKIEDTLVERYGVKNSSQIEGVQEKIKQHNIKKYGVENVFQVDEFKQKSKITMIEKYGVENAGQSKELRDKSKRTIMKKYGVLHQMYSDEIKIKIKQTNLERYGVEYATQSDIIKKKVKITNLERYGVEYGIQSEETKNKGKETCLEKYGVKNVAQKHIPQETISLLNNPEWLQTQHQNNKKTLEKISEELSVNATTVSDYFKKHNITINKLSVSQAERDIISFLKEHYSGTIIENTRSIISPKELDIYLPEINLAIEYCGLYWHSHIFKDKNYHLNKLNACKQIGIRLITIFSDEWIHKQDIMKSKLLNIINQTQQERLYARKCTISTPTIDERKSLLNEHHIQGDGAGSINLGLYYENKLVSVMSFKKHKNDIYELNRFASSVNVVGGFSKLLSHFKKTCNYKEIISFADKRWSEGNLYLKNGFTEVYTTKPDYRYIIGDQTYHKFGFRHKQLKNKLENYDQSLTEFQNTENHNIHRIYDCGKIKYSFS